MAAATAPAPPAQMPNPSGPSLPFDLDKPPVIDGFSPLSDFARESNQDKFLRKVKENPFVPIGCIGTVAVLVMGLRAFHQQKFEQSQKFMRARVVAQGFTVFATLFGVLTAALKDRK